MVNPGAMRARAGLRGDKLRVGAGAVTALLASWSAALGGDYGNVCSDPHGVVKLYDGALELGAAAAAPGAAPIAYETKAVTILRAEEGYCVAAQAPDQKFRYMYRSSAMTLEYALGGETLRVDVICEEYADGLPAAYSCAERVVTHRGGAHLE